MAVSAERGEDFQELNRDPDALRKSGSTQLPHLLSRYTGAIPVFFHLVHKHLEELA